MSCQACRSSVFFHKLGRCRRCMIQLTIASPLCWLIGLFGYSDRPHSLEAITFLVVASAMSLLLLAHLIRARQLRHAPTEPRNARQ